LPSDEETDVSDQVPKSAAKGLWDGFYDLLLHVESAAMVDLHRSNRSELEALQTRLRVAASEAKLILQRHSGALGIARSDLPWSD
jgi:hypothetical protein